MAGAAEAGAGAVEAGSPASLAALAAALADSGAGSLPALLSGREETQLRRQFGGWYSDYAAGVRRWI